jgi:Raf kinase inhibitor-like YbhB/YbcL family protein
MSLHLTSPAFAAGQPIPRRHTGDGEDLSPPLSWSGLPVGTRELALIVDDPDAPTPEPWVHWLIYKIPATESEGSLSEGIVPTSQLQDPAGACQGLNSWNTAGYRGPLPPRGHGSHRYQFRLYALDRRLTLGPNLDKARLLAAIKPHLLGQAELTGIYERPAISHRR